MTKKFYEPGQLDGGVDIQSKGGYIKLILKSNKTYSAEIFIPEISLSNYPAGLQIQEGKFEFKQDTLKFVEPFLIPYLFCDKNKVKLIYIQSFRPYEIVFVKVQSF